MPPRFHRPAAEPAVRCQHRVVAGSVREEDPARRRLVDFLTAVDEDAEPAVARIAGDLALELVLGLPPSQPLTCGFELDNVLLPVVSRLGQRRVPAVFGRKVHAPTSTLTASPASHRLRDEPPMVTVRATGPCEAADWRDQIRHACATALAGRRPHPGAASVHLAFGVSSLRNWTSLWKPAIDAIAGPLLGPRDPGEPWPPNDQQITELGLHRTTDDRAGYDAVISAWWFLHP